MEYKTVDLKVKDMDVNSNNIALVKVLEVGEPKDIPSIGDRKVSEIKWATRPAVF